MEDLRTATAATTLAELTTLHVGGGIRRLIHPLSRDALTRAIALADAEDDQLLILGGGSNLLASDDPFNGVVIQDQRRDITAAVAPDRPGHRLVTASAGTVWDEFVQWTLDQGLCGLEALSGIPGTVGAAPVQNVGAYGHEVGETLDSVLVWDRGEGVEKTLDSADLALSYRNSNIKRSIYEGDDTGRTWGPTGRSVVLEATFLLEESPFSAPVMYRELAARLGIEQGERADARLVRDTVLALRRSKGMVLDPEDHDTWSAGSFFTNPILTAAEAAGLPEAAPRFPAGVNEAGEDLVKTSAAWLIDHAGFAKGWAVPGARAEGASLSHKHVLALTNRGRATSGEVEELARAIIAGVEGTFGVTLVAEPVTVGITW